ncbi:MAG: MFS transporter [Rubrivivax sp. SCN 71-131]|jgi:MFS family permease|nr:MAG: MFS transporter [Rubrivivax sp. SCN 71-131]
MTTAAASAPLREDATTIGVVSIAHGMSHFCQLIVPPLFPWLTAAFALSNTQLGLLMSVFFVFSWAGQAAAGFVVDRWGADRVLMGGLAILALAAAGLAASPSYASMFVFMALAGLGNCVFHPVDFSIMNDRVSAPRLGHAYAAHGISGNLGWALAPVFVVGITTLSGSWRIALGAVALVVLAVLLLVWLQRERLVVRQVPRHAAQAGGGSDFGFLRLPAVWSCFAFFLVFALALGGVQTFAPAAAGQLHGVPVEQVAICLSIYMVAAGVGMVLGGHLVRDAQRSVRVAAAGFAIAAVVAVMMALGRWSPMTVLALFAVMGLGSGIAGPSRDLLVKQATPAGATGRVYGVVYSGLDVGMMLAALFFGALMDGGHYRGVWLAMAGSLALLILTAINVRRSARPLAPVAAGA